MLNDWPPVPVPVLITLVKPDDTRLSRPGCPAEAGLSAGDESAGTSSEDLSRECFHLWFRLIRP